MPRVVASAAMSGPFLGPTRRPGASAAGRRMAKTSRKKAGKDVDKGGRTPARLWKARGRSRRMLIVTSRSPRDKPRDRLDASARPTARPKGRALREGGFADSLMARGALRFLLAREIPGIHEIGELDVPGGPEERVLDPGMTFFQPLEERFDLLALEGRITAGGTAAADHRELHLSRVLDDILLPDVNHGPDHGMHVVLGSQDRRHGLDLPVEELQHEQRLDDVVGMMA